jgi:hypothetical protein
MAKAHLSAFASKHSLGRKGYELCPCHNAALWQTFCSRMPPQLCCDAILAFKTSATMRIYGIGSLFAFFAQVFAQTRKLRRGARVIYPRTSLDGCADAANCFSDYL